MYILFLDMAVAVTKFSPYADRRAPLAWPRAAVLDYEALLIDVPGAQRLLPMLHGRLRLAAAGNAPAPAMLAALRRCALQSLLTVLVSAEEAGASGPRRDVHLQACRRLAVHPSDAIAFEGSAAGAQAAQAAGLTVIVVSSEPSARALGDLATSRIDDPRVLGMFGLQQAPQLRLAAPPLAP